MALDPAPFGGRTYPAIPADLLHVVIELDAVSVGVEGKGRVIDAGVELWWDRVDKSHAVRLQKGDGPAQLRVAADLDPERHAGRALAETQRAPQLLGEEPDAVVFGAAAQKYTASPAVYRLLASDKAEALGIEVLGALDVIDEEADRTDLGDLEWARQQHALYIVGCGKSLFRAVSGEHLDALAECLLEFGGL